MSAETTTLPATSERAILSAAHDLIVESGVSKLTVQSVATRAGVSRMTVYRHHENLDGIIRTLMTVEIGAIVAAAEQTVDGVVPVRAAVTQVVRHVVLQLFAHPLFRSVVSSDASVLLPLLTTRFGSGQSLLRNHLAEQLRRGMTAFDGDGSIRDADPSELAFLIVIACQSFVVSAPVVDEHVSDLSGELDRLLDGWLS